MSIRLTPTAADQVKRYLKQWDQGIGLRLSVRKSGCSGYAHVLDLTNHVTEHDEVFPSSGVDILVRVDHLPMLRGTEIDFVREGLNEVFTFRNPNVKSECGCGESFGL